MKNPFQSESVRPKDAKLGHTTPAQRQLREYIESNSDHLLNTLAMYVRQSGLAQGMQAKEDALELLSEVTVEALAHAERYDPSRPLMAWLLGIGNNLLLRRRANQARQAQRGDLARDHSAVHTEQDGLSDDELFERFAESEISEWNAQPLEDMVIADDEMMRLLSPLSAEEQRVLYLSKIHNLDGDELAKELGISPGAARVRLTRALNHLRQIWGAGKTSSGRRNQK